MRELREEKVFEYSKKKYLSVRKVPTTTDYHADTQRHKAVSLSKLKHCSYTKIYFFNEYIKKKYIILYQGIRCFERTTH